jgi:hypothetical protein
MQNLLLLRQLNMSKYVMPDPGSSPGQALIRHPVFSMDSGFRRNDEFIYLIAGVITTPEQSLFGNW